MKRISYEPAAMSDLRSAKRYYDQQRPGLGKELVLEVKAQLLKIVEHPHAFRVIDKGVRKAPIKRFLFDIYYLPSDEEIVVVAIMHRRRHPDSWRRL